MSSFQNKLKAGVRRLKPQEVLGARTMEYYVKLQTKKIHRSKANYSAILQ
jgi:hypothetical protein